MSVSVFCLSMLRQVWPDRVLDWPSEILCERLSFEGHAAGAPPRALAPAPFAPPPPPPLTGLGVPETALVSGVA